MLCVPRSWAASPWVIDRQIVIRLAIWAVLAERLAEQHAVDVRLDLLHLPAVFDRSVGLRIERLLVGHPAGQVDVDDRLRLSPRSGRSFLRSAALPAPRSRGRVSVVPASMPTWRNPRRESRSKCAGNSPIRGTSLVGLEFRRSKVGGGPGWAEP